MEIIGLVPAAGQAPDWGVYHAARRSGPLRVAEQATHADTCGELCTSSIHSAIQHKSSMPAEQAQPAMKMGSSHYVTPQSGVTWLRWRPEFTGSTWRWLFLLHRSAVQHLTGALRHVRSPADRSPCCTALRCNTPPGALRHFRPAGNRDRPGIFAIVSWLR